MHKTICKIISLGPAIFGGKRALEFSLGGYLEYEKWILTWCNFTLNNVNTNNIQGGI